MRMGISLSGKDIGLWSEVGLQKPGFVSCQDVDIWGDTGRLT